MSRLRSLVLAIEVDTAQRRHSCQRNDKHEILKGDKRLKVKAEGRSPDHYCVECGRKILETDIQELQSVLQQLTSP